MHFLKVYILCILLGYLHQFNLRIVGRNHSHEAKLIYSKLIYCYYYSLENAQESSLILNKLDSNYKMG